jgi:pimeloyl-ACP methyl ester carboxylesterase
MKRYLRYGFIGLLAIMVALAALLVFGAVYEVVMAAGDGERFPPTGRLVVTESGTMHLHCIGEGAPTVVLEAGSNSWSDAWALMQPQVGAFARVCSYDRAGYGWSEASSLPRTPEQIAHDLQTLLTMAAVPPPYILVGHSAGGKAARLFASFYATDVAGLVLVDARHESVEPQDRTPEQNAADREAYESSLNLYRILRNTGIARLFGLSLGRSVDPSLTAYPDDVAYRMVMFSARESTLQTMMAESRASTDSDALLASAGVAPALPVYVLTAESSLEQDGWEAAQAQLAALSSNSAWDVVANSTHNLPADQPAAITAAIRGVLTAAQTGAPLQGG